MSQETDTQTPVPERPQADVKFALSPNESRFLFVEVAAQRAKQLRRGALNRLVSASDEGGVTEALPPVHKPERVAMEEVRRGFIQYGLAEDAAPQAKAEERS